MELQILSLYFKASVKAPWSLYHSTLCFLSKTGLSSICSSQIKKTKDTQHSSVSVCDWQSISKPVCVCQSICPPLCVCQSISQPLCDCQSIFPPLYLSTCLCLSVYLSTSLSLDLSVSVSLYLNLTVSSVYLNLSVSLSLFLWRSHDLIVTVCPLVDPVCLPPTRRSRSLSM